jgi:glycosyltransferase involved in cell wall biosynthesis
MPNVNARTVLLIGPFPPPIGGDTVLTLNLSRSRYWKEHGIKIKCIDTSPGDRVRLPDEPVSMKDIVRGARILRDVMWNVPRCRVVLLWANSRFLLTAGIAIILWCRLSGRPVFAKVFGAFLARRIKLQPAVSRRLTRMVLGMTVCIFPETEHLARELVNEAGIRAERVLLLSNFLPDRALAIPLVPKRFSGKCVFVGQIKREKGVFDIIEALRGRDGMTCDFFGPLLERDRREFLDSVSTCPACSYRGALEPGTVSATAAEYDVLLLPTYHSGEGQPAVILEAYAAGIPVIASDWLSLPELVKDGVTGILVPVRNPGKIGEALERLRSDAGLYQSMREHASGFVSSFSETAVVEGVLVPRVLHALSGGERGRESARDRARTESGE